MLGHYVYVHDRKDLLINSVSFALKYMGRKRNGEDKQTKKRDQNIAQMEKNK